MFFRVLMIAWWKSGPQMTAASWQHSVATQQRSVTWLSTTRTLSLPQRAVTKPSECGAYAPVHPSLFCRPMVPPSHPFRWDWCMLKELLMQVWEQEALFQVFPEQPKWPVTGFHFNTLTLMLRFSGLYCTMSAFTPPFFCYCSIVVNVGHSLLVTNQHWLCILLVLSCYQRDNAVLVLHRCRRHGVFLEVALNQHEIQVSVWNICGKCFSYTVSSFTKVCRLHENNERDFMFLQWSASQVCWAVTSRSTGLYFLFQ